MKIACHGARAITETALVSWSAFGVQWWEVKVTLGFTVKTSWWWKKWFTCLYDWKKWWYYQQWLANRLGTNADFCHYCDLLKWFIIIFLAWEEKGIVLKPSSRNFIRLPPCVYIQLAVALLFLCLYLSVSHHQFSFYVDDVIFCVLIHFFCFLMIFAKYYLKSPASFQLQTWISVKLSWRKHNHWLFWTVAVSCREWELNLTELHRKTEIIFLVILCVCRSYRTFRIK